MSGFRSLTLLAPILATSLVAIPSTAAGQVATPSVETLELAVSAEVVDRATLLPDVGDVDRTDTRISVTRQAGAWAFGTAVLVAPAREGGYPHGWLFLARGGSSWEVALEDDAQFAAWAVSAEVLSMAERATFSAMGGRSEYAGGDYRTGMRLPFATGQSWTMSGGPHGSPVWDAIDLHGGDQVVRAARAGTAYTMCQGWLRVVHDRGYATDYYHLWNNIWVDGKQVSAGTRLGDTGTDVTCGGSATGRHVHQYPQERRREVVQLRRSRVHPGHRRHQRWHCAQQAQWTGHRVRRRRHGQ
jgi:LasA protease